MFLKIQVYCMFKKQILFLFSKTFFFLILGLDFGEENVLGSFRHNNSFLHRVKRATTSSKRKVIEVAIFVDSELYKKIEATTTIDARRATVNRVLAIMNQVRFVFQKSSLSSVRNGNYSLRANLRRPNSNF